MDDRISKLEKLAEDTNLRLTSLEREVASLKQDVAIIRSNYATKGDLYEAINGQTWRLVTFVCGFGVTLVTATWFIFAHTR